eukprot:scaffold66699_cov102-Cyclotella_meneghiniana.AAC.1
MMNKNVEETNALAAERVKAHNDMVHEVRLAEVRKIMTAIELSTSGAHGSSAGSNMLLSW